MSDEKSKTLPGLIWSFCSYGIHVASALMTTGEVDDSETPVVLSEARPAGTQKAAGATAKTRQSSRFVSRNRGRIRRRGVEVFLCK